MLPEAMVAFLTPLACSDWDEICWGDVSRGVLDARPKKFPLDRRLLAAADGAVDEVVGASLGGESSEDVFRAVPDGKLGSFE